MFERLVKEAKFAINTNSRDLIMETYGIAKMARELEYISFDEFLKLTSMLIRDGIDNLDIKLR